jgi:hypothetical protein
LIREFLFDPCQRLSKLVGSGLCVTREPRLPSSDVRCICSLTSIQLSAAGEGVSIAKRRQLPKKIIFGETIPYPGMAIGRRQHYFSFSMAFVAMALSVFSSFGYTREFTTT